MSVHKEHRSNNDPEIQEVRKLSLNDNDTGGTGRAAKHRNSPAIASFLEFRLPLRLSHGLTII